MIIGDGAYKGILIPSESWAQDMIGLAILASAVCVLGILAHLLILGLLAELRTKGPNA